MYDTIAIGKSEGQVKLWQMACTVLTEGSGVPSVDGRKTYSVAMREGGFVNIERCVITSWTKRPKHRFVFDKYGNLATERLTGITGEPYLFSDTRKEFMDDKKENQKATASHHKKGAKRAVEDGRGEKAKRKR
jgi:hypothetical protein